MCLDRGVEFKINDRLEMNLPQNRSCTQTNLLRVKSGTILLIKLLTPHEKIVRVMVIRQALALEELDIIKLHMMIIML